MTQEISRPEKTVMTKFIIDTLRSRPHTEEEMKTMLIEKLLGSEGARKRKWYRYMPDLIYMGIVELSFGKYRLRLSTDRTKISDDAMVKHSHNLVPALEQIARIETLRYASEVEHISERDMSLLIDCAMDHLSYYLDVWKLIEKRTRLEEKIEQMREKFCLNQTEKLKNEFGDEPIADSGDEVKYRSFIGTSIPDLILSCLLFGTSAQIILEGEKIWATDRLRAKGPHLLTSIREFVNREIDDDSNIRAAKMIKDARKSATVIGSEIECKVREIILGIKSDISLCGRCRICRTTDDRIDEEEKDNVG